MKNNKNNASKSIIWVRAFISIVALASCQVLFAGTTGDGGLDAVVAGVQQTTNNGYMGIVALASVIVGLVTSIMQSSLVPIGISCVIVVVAKLMLGYVGATFTLLI